MRIETSTATDVGRVRDHNEDAFLVDAELGLYVVCDGMGGHASGEVASGTTIQVVQRYLREHQADLAKVDRGEAGPELLGHLLSEAISGASIAVNDLGVADRSKRGMGTTCCALLVRGGKGVMGHVGDSRLYVVRGGLLYQLSEDHTFVQEAIRHGLMTPQQAKDSGQGNVVTRAVGAQRIVRVDTLGFDMLPGDTYLLCSDGLHSYTEDPQELRALLDVPGVGEIAPRLVAIANERGGHDNITAIVLRVASDDQPALDTARALQVNSELAALRHIELFTELTMAELVRVYGAFKEVQCASGQTVIQEGEQSSSVFVIAAGAMEVQRGHQTLATLPPGSHFGEMALLNQRPRTATVRATQDCRLLVLDREAFVALIREDAVLGVRLLWRLAATLSMRLDDVLLLQGATQPPPISPEMEADTLPAPTKTGEPKHTLRFGTLPSPYPRQ